MTAPMEILLATYNGARHLHQLIDSILAQTIPNWRIIARDDGSNDATPNILAEYQRRLPDRFHLVEDDGRRLGPCGNFDRLLSLSTSPYVMFADQDDLWLPDKIRLTLVEMQRLEGEAPPETPLLVHTDLVVVDDALRTIAPSLWRYHHNDPVGGKPLNRLLVQNIATGCTIMVNRPLICTALPIPPEAVMHDWWLALTASTFGRIGEISEPTVRYRQHGGNDTGARRFGIGDMIDRLMNRQEVRHELQRIQRQGGAFLDRFHLDLSPHQRLMLQTFARLDTLGPLRRRWSILRYRFFYTGLARNIGRLIIG